MTQLFFPLPFEHYIGLGQTLPGGRQRSQVHSAHRGPLDEMVNYRLGEILVQMCQSSRSEGLDSSQLCVGVPLREEEDPRADPHAVYGGSESGSGPDAVRQRRRLREIGMQHPGSPLPLLVRWRGRDVAGSARKRKSAIVR